MGTTRSRRIWWPVLLAAVTIAGAASCGTSDTPQVRMASAGVTTTTAASSRADWLAAEAALISVDEIPAGFKETMSMSSGDTAPYEQVPECGSFVQTVAAVEGKRTAKARTKFTNEAKDEIAEDVEVYRDTPIAKTVASALGDPGFARCFEAVFTSVFAAQPPAGATVGAVSVVPAKDVPSASELGVDSVTGLVLQIPLAANGRDLTMRFEFAVLTHGRSTASLTVQSGAPLDLGPIIQAAATKLKTIDAA